MLNNRIKKLETQMSYTSDNTSVILSDVQTMQDDIKSTLEEEASLITDWDISLKSADFTDMTYTVSVSVVPKEYTEDTKPVYFSVQTRYRSSSTASSIRVRPPFHCLRTMQAM